MVLLSITKTVPNMQCFLWCIGYYLKDKIDYGFSQTQQYIILFYLDDDMFR